MRGTVYVATFTCTQGMLMHAGVNEEMSLCMTYSSCLFAFLHMMVLKLGHSHSKRLLFGPACCPEHEAVTFAKRH